MIGGGQEENRRLPTQIQMLVGLELPSSGGEPAAPTCPHGSETEGDLGASAPRESQDTPVLRGRMTWDTLVNIPKPRSAWWETTRIIISISRRSGGGGECGPGPQPQTLFHCPSRSFFVCLSAGGHCAQSDRSLSVGAVRKETEAAFSSPASSRGPGPPGAGVQNLMRTGGGRRTFTP